MKQKKTSAIVECIVPLYHDGFVAQPINLANYNATMRKEKTEWEWIDTINISRIKYRVKMGGHSVYIPTSGQKHVCSQKAY